MTTQEMVNEFALLDTLVFRNPQKKLETNINRFIPPNSSPRKYQVTILVSNCKPS